VTEINITNSYASLVLERSGKNWRINHSYNAKSFTIKSLLNLLTNLEISSPIPKSMKQEVLKSFDNRAVAITIGTSGKVLKAYRIAENDSLHIGTLMMLKDDTEPYIVRFPGYDGHISSLFSTDPLLWRDKTIFRYRPADILSIQVEYPSSPKASFAYYFMGMDNLQIKSLVNNKIIKISKKTALGYLVNFMSVSFEKLVKEHRKELYDSLKQQQPFCTITVKNTVNQLNSVKAYHIPVQNKPGEFNPDKMYAVLQNDTIPAIIKYIDLDPITKEFSDFEAR
jgi:hypothetical protein